VAVNPNGKSVFAANIFSGTVSQYSADPSTGALSPKDPATVPAGDLPDGIAVGPAPPVPTSIEQCKNGGWRQFGFKGQGQCVAFVILSKICDVLLRRGQHPKFCPPALPIALRP
jgi:hypothetical protein